MASEIRVNLLENRSGLGTNTYTDTGLIVAGIVTANSFSGAFQNSGDFTIDDWIVHAGDTDTKFGFSAADTIQFHTGGSSRFSIDASGHATFKRSLNLTASGDNHHIIQGRAWNWTSNGLSNGTVRGNIYADSSGNVRIGSNGWNERLRIKSDGDIIFIGTTPGNNANKSVNLVGLSYNTSEEDVNLLQYEGETGFNQISIGGGTSGLNAATAIRFLTASAVNTTGGTERLRIASNGFVGIGTIAPATALHSYGGGTGFRLEREGSNPGYYNVAISHGTPVGANNYGSVYFTLSQTTGDYVWKSSSTERMRLLGDSGRLGIGDDNPASLLSLKASNPTIRFTDGSTLVGAIEGGGGANIFYGYNGADLIFSTASNASYDDRLRIDSDGRVIVGGGTHAGGGQFVVMGGHINTYAAIALGNRTAAPTDNTTFAMFRFNSGSGGTSRGAEIIAKADANWSAGSSYPTRLVFSTTPSGATSASERLCIKADGKIGIGHHSDDQIAKDLTIRPANDGGIRFIRPGDTPSSPNIHLDLTTTTSGSAFPTAEAYTVKYRTMNCDQIFETYAGGGTGGHISFRTSESNNQHESMRIYPDGHITMFGSGPWSDPGVTDFRMFNGNFDIADDTTVTITDAANTGALVCVGSYKRSGGSVTYASALFFITYASTTVTKISDPRDIFRNVNTDGYVCVYKSSSTSGTFYVRNRIGTTNKICINVINLQGL